MELFGFSKREMENPLVLCELAARAPHIIAGRITPFHIDISGVSIVGVKKLQIPKGVRAA